MSFVSWLKDLFIEKNEEAQVEDEMQNIQPVTQADYNFKIFDLKNKDELNLVNSFIVQDKALALIKMNKFTGDREQYKQVLNELKTACDNCNSKIVWISNNMFFVVKNSVEVLKE